jgi:general secretion pathway protein C
MTKLWTVKITTFLLWALAAGSAAFWVLKNVQGTAYVRPDAVAKVLMPNLAAEQNITPKIALALGAKNPVTPTAASALATVQARLQLQGVLSVGDKSGAALISVDGKPAKPYRMGSAIEDGLEVTSIKAREASIGTNGVAAFTLELPQQDTNLGLKK